ncbi:MAG: M6 family metalloprotease domain-containing protein [Bradymonadia bacterium]
MRHIVSACTALLLLTMTPAGAIGPGGDGPIGEEGLSGARARMVQDLAAMRFDRLGNPQLRWDHIPPVRASKKKPHNLLVVLVEFQDRGFERFKESKNQGLKLTAYYEDLLFDEGYAKPNTLSHYYRQQSLNTYHLQGQVLPPVKLERPRAAYGAPKRPAGGSWRNDSETEGLVEEALKAAVKQHGNLDWDAYDRWDPNDFDGDGVLDEPDGYLDHLVLIYAGGGQSSCQGLYKLHTVFTPNAAPDVIDTLSPEARECAERLWPHRFAIQRREGQGPVVEGRTHARGGVPMGNGLWSLDYNMQSEYTEAATFIHEFGHSIGLPDIYARSSSNSTGGWEVMSSTASPSPQNLSAWSRIMLGWLRPIIVTPPAFGGKPTSSFYLRTLDDPLDPASVARANQKAGLWRAGMIILPPKTLKLDLTELAEKQGKMALYSGQGNGMNRTATLPLDLREAKKSATLSFDAWWEVEGGWDFVYAELSTDGGRSWTRVLPTDKAMMPAKHGHDGKQSLPGFTGLSGDLDGDGKNESAKACDPKKKLAHGEDRSAEQENPCLAPTWVNVSFDLGAAKGKEALFRLRYFTDMAAVMRGMLIDNVTVKADGAAMFTDDFEARAAAEWRLDGFTRSPGKHTLLVPHYYLVEHRDPYAEAKDHYRYDAGLARPGVKFFFDPKAQAMAAVRSRPRPGVVLWYYDGAYAWSENDPATNGQGKGFLLAVDANPNEIKLPGLDTWFQGDDKAFDTRYELKSESAQEAMKSAFYKTVCFVRDMGWYPVGLPEAELKAECHRPKAPVQDITYEGRGLMYSYRIINEMLPGAARERYWGASELYDYRVKKPKAGPGKPTEPSIFYRMRDRTLRYMHTLDAPFSLKPFEDALVFYRVDGKSLVPTEKRPAPAVKRFDDRTSERWANPKLYFGGVKVPPEGLSIELAEPGKHAPDEAQVKIWVDWR